MNLTEMRACTARELAMRLSAYPKWVASGKMKQEVADRETEAMRCVDEFLNTISEGEFNAFMANRKMPLYQQFVEVYSAFLKQHNTGGMLFNGRDGKQIKEIYQKLVEVSTKKTDEGALEAWQYILANWHKLSEFIGRQITVPQINKNLSEILIQIKNANKKITSGTNTGADPGSAAANGKLWKRD